MDYKKEFEYWLEKTSSEELKAIQGDEKEIKERFYTRLAFGTAGMRGTVELGTNRMNVYTVSAATKGLADYINSIGKADKGVAISYDTRRCSTTFALEAAKVLSANKIKVYLFENVRPVPVISYTVRHLGCIAGIMITASHNPKEYNGYKVYGEDGAQMSPEATAVVVDFIDKINDYFSIEKDEAEGLNEEDIRGKDNYKINDYITVIGNSVNESYYKEIEGLSLSPEAVKKYASALKIVYTPIHGSGYVPVTDMLTRMGIPFTVVKEQAMPDTEFSTVSVPNPENPNALSMGIELAKKIGATVVIGTDPDCDRMGVAVMKRNGEFFLLNGNQIGCLLMDYILQRRQALGTLPKNAATIKTIVTSSLAKKISESYGAVNFDVLTGFKFIGEKIKEWEQTGEYTYVFGFEESYGSLAGTHARDKDAVVATMLFAEMVCYYKGLDILVSERLEEIFKKFGYYADKAVSLVFKGLDGMDKMNAIMDKLHTLRPEKIGDTQIEFISDYQKRTTYNKDGSIDMITLPKTNAVYYGLEGGNWLCVRPSGTEPKLKIYVSISDKISEQNAHEKADKLIEEIQKLF